MAVTDLWVKRDGSPSNRNGVGLRYRVTVPGYPAKAFRNKAPAKAYELQLLSQGPVKAAPTTTVGELLPKWLAGKDYLSRSAKSVVVAGGGRVRERWGDVMVHEVYTHDVQEWIVGIMVGDHLASRDLMSKTLSALRGTLDIARTLGLLEANPCAGVKLPRAERRDARFLDVAELRTLAGKAKGDTQPMIWLLATTGVRVGECCRLNVGDIDVKRARLRVRKSKNGTARDVPIPASVLAMLRVEGRAKDEPLFVGKKGKRVEVRNWRRREFEPAATASGIKDLHVHDLRHTAASLMIRSGATPKDVQMALGHKSASMTLDLYAGWWADALDGVSAKMEKMLS